MLRRAIDARLLEQEKRTGQKRELSENISELLDKLTVPIKNKIQARYLERRKTFEKAKDRSVSDETITERLITEYDETWNSLEKRLLIVPGKDTLALLNSHLQGTCGITITPTLIVDTFDIGEVHPEMVELIESINKFSQMIVV